MTTGNPLKNDSKSRDYPSNKTEEYFDYTDINALQTIDCPICLPYRRSLSLHFVTRRSIGYSLPKCYPTANSINPFPRSTRRIGFHMYDILNMPLKSACISCHGTVCMKAFSGRGRGGKGRQGDGMLTVMMMMYATSLATTSTKHSDIDKTQSLLTRRCAPYIFLFPESVGSSRRS